MPECVAITHRSWLAVGALTIAVLAVGAPVLAGHVLYYGDITVQFEPWRALCRQSLVNGTIPLWTDRVFCGQPVLGNPQCAVLYPPNWLLWLLEPARGLAIGYLLHLWLAVIGGYVCARAASLNSAAAVAAGLIYGLGGFFVSKAQFPSLFDTLAWLPWLLWAGSRLADAPDARRCGGLAVVVWLQWLAGHAQMALISLSLLVLWSALAPNNRLSWKHWSWLNLAVALGSALAAAQLLPTAEVVALSERSAYTLLDSARYYLPPWALALAIHPRLLGAPDLNTIYLGPSPYWELLWYVGVCAWPLAAAALSSTSDKRRWLWVALLVISLTLALGPVTPVYGWLWRLVPPVRMFHDPARFALGATVALSALAALGLHAERRAVSWWALAFGLAAFASWVALRLVPPTLVEGWLDRVAAWQPELVVPDRVATARYWQWLMARCLLASAGWLVLLAVATTGPKRQWRVAVVMVLCADLVWHAQPLNPTTPAGGFSVDPRTSEVASLDGPLLFVGTGPSTYTRWFGVLAYRPAEVLAARRSLMPNVTATTPTQLVGGYDPLAPAAVHEWVQMLWRLTPQQRSALLAPLGVAGEWDGRQLYRYAEARPPVHELTTGALVASRWVSPQRRVIMVTASPSSTVSLIQTPAPGWRIRGANLTPGEAPVTQRLTVPPSGRETVIRLWYSPLSYRAGLFVALLALSLLAALAVGGRSAVWHNARQESGWRA